MGYITEVPKFIDDNPERVVPADEETKLKVRSRQQKIMRDFFRDKYDSLISRLSMLKLHVNVSLVSSKPQQMLLSLVTPSNLTILLKLLLVSQASVKIHLIKILDGLRRNKLPVELFDEAARPLLQDDSS